MSKTIITHAVELQIQFVFEKRTEPYKWYGEGSIREENWIWSQEISKPQALLEDWLIGVWL